MGTRKQTWCDHCGKEGPVDGVQLTTTRQKRSTEGKTKEFDVCDGCLKELKTEFLEKMKHVKRPRVTGNRYT